MGFSYKFVETPVTYYLIHTLRASPAQISACVSLSTLPWSFKFLYGMLIDGISIMSYRRKPWLLIGWIVFILVNLCLAYLKTPNIPTTILLVFFSFLFLFLSEICNETLSVERARLESVEKRGYLQTKVATIRQFGYFLGTVAGSILYNKNTWGWGLDISGIFVLQGLVPLGVLVSAWSMVEITYGFPSPTFHSQITSLWYYCLLCYDI
jgi:MFS family permease